MIETGQSRAKVSLLVDAAAPTTRRASTAEFVGEAAAPPGTSLAVPPACTLVTTSTTALLISEKTSHPADADNSPDRYPDRTASATRPQDVRVTALPGRRQR